MAIRIPVSTGSRKGLSKVIATAGDQRVVLTSHGRAVAVVDSAERIDEDLGKLRDAADAVIEFAVGSAVDGAGKRWDLDAVCGRLGIDASVVRRRAQASQQS